MTKEEIVKAIRVCAKQLGRNPSMRELRGMAGVTARSLYTRLGSAREAFESAGLVAKGPGFSQPEPALLQDWGAVARKLRKVPSMMEYQRAGRYSNQQFVTHYGSWIQVPRAFRAFAQGKSVRRQWRDVLEIIAAEPAKKMTAWSRESAKEAAKPRERTFLVRKGPLLKNRPVYGRPLQLPELAHEPVNELGVVFAFGIMARRLGFVVHRMQAGFPDCIAMREMARGQWQRVRVEFEFESRNFLKHRHPKNKCDVIVCWVHNWPGCPENLEVVELRQEIARAGDLLGG